MGAVWGVGSDGTWGCSDRYRDQKQIYPWTKHFELKCSRVLCLPVICATLCLVLSGQRWLGILIQIYYKENLSGFFPSDLPVVKISPEWVTNPEKGKSSARVATFSLWTGEFRDGISCIPGETVISLWLGRHFLVCENRVYHEKWE